MSWKCGQWNSANAGKHRIKSEICMEVTKGTLSMRAWKDSIDFSTEYTICVYDNVNSREIVSKTFYNKDEANGFWAIMRIRYFSEPYKKA